MSAITLGYWNVRGMAQPVRLLLEYLGIDYENKVYDFDVSDLTDKKKMLAGWLVDKMGCPLLVGGEGEEPMDFPNLPYYIETRADGSKFKLTQTLAILRYLARRNNLMVDNEEDFVKMDLMEQQVVDVRACMLGYCFGNPFTYARYPNYADDVKEAVFTHWDNKVLAEKKWIMGDKLTYIDFIFWEYLDWHILLKGDFLENMPNLEAYYERFKNLPKIKNYLESSRYKNWPLVHPLSKFGWHRS